MIRPGLRPALLALVGCGCGYVGDPLPPALNIPVPVTDLSVIELGSKIVAQFSMPHRTTEGLELPGEARPELFIGDAGPPPFDVRRWATAAKVVSDMSSRGGRVRCEIPAYPWQGRDVVIGVRVQSAKGRNGGWSNLVTLRVEPPLEPPGNVRAAGTSSGVRITWSGAAPEFRVFRRTGEERALTLLATAPRPEYVDATAAYGKTYHYAIQAARGQAESDLSPEAVIVHEDKFPPEVPSGLTAVAGVSSVELVWNENTDADLAGYRVYRADGGGPFRLISGPREAPSYSFSDKDIRPGTRYRYAVSSVDKSGNESDRSAAVEMIVP